MSARQAPGRAVLYISSRYSDLAILLSLTLVASVLRLWSLGGMPPGLHGDEAQLGMDARRVLTEGWIGPYTHSALGQPSGHAYLTAPAIWLFGSGVWAVRLPLALVGIAAVPLAYLLFRLQSGRIVATIAAFLLAVSLWHIHYSRVAHWPISYVTVALGVLVLWTLAMQRGRWYWFASAGLLLGLGLYTYNIYPIFVIAFAVWVAVYTLLIKRRDRVWLRNVGLAAVVSFIVALPLFIYMADPSSGYFDHYRSYYEQYSVLHSAAFEGAGLGGKVEIIADKAASFLSAYAWHGVTDYVDGAAPDEKPMLDTVTVALFIVGAIYALRHWRRTPDLLALIMLAIIPLPTVLQNNGIFRGPLGVVPFVAFLAALPLAQAWQLAQPLRPAQRLFAHGTVALALVFVAYSNLTAYFGDWARSDIVRLVYAEEITEASQYIAARPGTPYVYFLSARWRFDYETRQYLAPRAQGEDRSREFGSRQDLAVDRSRSSLIVLLPPYLGRAVEVERLYPEASSFEKRDGDRTLFRAYQVPPLPEVTPGVGLVR